MYSQGDTEMTEELADRLFEAGCDDGLPGMSCGVPCIDFSREADSLEAAIRSAIADLQKAGCVAAEVRSRSGSLRCRVIDARVVPLV